jgi:glycosyltransferase involved in cell wall biosynthesis
MRENALNVWRHLPIGLRRKLAHGAIEAMAPKLSPFTRLDLQDLKLPRIVVGFLSSPSGLGQSARLAARAFAASGMPVSVVDLSRYFYEGRGQIDHGFPDASRSQGPGHVVIVINAPYMPYALFLLGRGFLRDRHVSGYWAWELPTAPKNWRRGLKCVHDVVVPSSFTAKAVRRLDANAQIRVALHPVALDYPTTEYGIKKNKFTVVAASNVASGFTRKNPLAIIRAFELAFGNSNTAQLNLLLTNGEQYEKGMAQVQAVAATMRNVSISTSPMTRRDFLQWWGEPDAYISLHRSEGFGLGIAEAMCAGVPTIATGWSGNMDFMNTDNSLPIRYNLVDVEDDQGKYPSDLGQWADADVFHAAQCLVDVAERSTVERAEAWRKTTAVRAELTAQAFAAAMCA